MSARRSDIMQNGCASGIGPNPDVAACGRNLRHGGSMPKRIVKYTSIGDGLGCPRGPWQLVSQSILRQIFDPFKDPKHVGVASKIIFSRSDTEKMAALLVSHSALDALRKSRKLVYRWLLAHPFLLV